MSVRARRLWLGGWIVVVWVALWGDVSAANLLGGLLVAAVLLTVFPEPSSQTAGHELHLRPFAALSFTAWFAKELVMANLAVAWLVIAPHARLREGIVRAPLRSRSAAIHTLVANAITLTPGTLTVDVIADEAGNATAYVHVLSLPDPETTRAEVQELEERAVRAFGSEPDRRRTGDPALPGGHVG